MTVVEPSPGSKYESIERRIHTRTKAIAKAKAKTARDESDDLFSHLDVQSNKEYEDGTDLIVIRKLYRSQSKAKGRCLFGTIGKERTVVPLATYL